MQILSLCVQRPLLQGTLALGAAHGELQEQLWNGLRDMASGNHSGNGIVLALAGCAFPSGRRDLASGIPVPLAAGASKSRPLCWRTTFFLYYAIPYANKFATVCHSTKKDDAQRASSGLLLSGKRDSNPRPSAWEADALPTELFPQWVCKCNNFFT